MFSKKFSISDNSIACCQFAGIKVVTIIVFLIVGINAGIDPTLLAFILIGTNSYGGSVTHYGAAPGPIIFSAGYNNVKDWWTVGLISAVVCLVLNYVIGIPWWKIAGFM